MNKITALEKTIFNLENDVYHYNWTSSETCNCGVLAHSIIECDTIWSVGFDEMQSEDYSLPPFSRRAHCMTTGVELPKIFQTLVDSGFSFNDIVELEECNSRPILERMGKENVLFFHTEHQKYKNLYRSDKDFVIEYLKAWVSILQEEETTSQPVQTPSIEAPAEQPKVIEKTVYVSVPTSITEQSKELILS